MSASGTAWDGFFAWSELRSYLRTGTPFRLVHPGKPDLEVFSDAAASHFGFRVETQDAQDLPASPLSSIRVRRAEVDGVHVIEVTCDSSALFEDFHALAALFAQRLRVKQLDPVTALDDVLTSLGRLIARSAVLPVESQIGLWGEIWVLLSHISAVGAATGVAAWAAPRGEEHDFVLSGADVEVKTTAGEVPRHVIHGLRQLEPKQGRGLYLLSVQITDGGAGGVSLPEVITTLRSRVAGGGPAVVASVEKGLERAGWLDEYAPYCSEKWLLRATPRLVPATDLPALVPGVVSLPEEELARLSDVRYTLDVTGRGHGVQEDVSQSVMQLDLG